MKAVQVTEFGDAKVLALTELSDPELGPGQVAIDVTHAAVGLIDVHLRQGLYEGVPGLPQPPYVPGLEVAGIVVAGFNAGGYLPAHPEAVPAAAAAAALTAAASGMADTEIELLPLALAATAHERLENHSAQGRVVLVP
ncbi:alcohol dehydrogenase catalytic domain-containing protein [Paractinoplanes brasiliensis]|uniref:Alcohol dehydrogenase-like N-terminal domain-containing protein n=1 Tax=Paractinoplanes brasiliensis TaxID=52695 RepID=A0A4R6JQD3_9ACTN|nr:hypothetical protein [Actinoplanes brasiliensis]TDO36825.1 hypothetical protein C8E87_0408 [Actinoplanes brasiliensis]GID30342.1 hypothetical protein Abr02nite_53250 [Actinoplanes brasiliensis]